MAGSQNILRRSYDKYYWFVKTYGPTEKSSYALILVVETINNQQIDRYLYKQILKHVSAEAWTVVKYIGMGEISISGSRWLAGLFLWFRWYEKILKKTGPQKDHLFTVIVNLATL